MSENKYYYITDVNSDFFILGGLVYHHQEILDPTERDKEFQKRVNEYKKKEAIRKGTYNPDDFNNYFDTEDNEFDINDIFALKAEMLSIKNSQSLSELAMNNVMRYFTNEPQEHPFEEMYSAKVVPSENIWISNGIKVIDSDKIIFISHKGLAGDIYDHSVQKQKLCIRYRRDNNLGLYIGDVFDYNVLFGFLEYEEHMEEILQMELNKDVD